MFRGKEKAAEVPSQQEAEPKAFVRENEGQKIAFKIAPMKRKFPMP